MTLSNDMMHDLYAYNDWANEKIASLCDGLTDQQLDAPREMGFGTLRATLFHILTAEVVWLERWQGLPWRPFPTEPSDFSIQQLREGLREVADQRRELIDENQQDRWSTRIQYLDSKKTPYDHHLFDLLLHVTNHGVHHRAQALNYLKQFDRSVIAGIDYIFYRLAKFSVKQSCDAKESLTAYGLEVSKAAASSCPWDSGITKRYFQYNDWATEQILEFAADLNDESLDRDFQMGPGSLRKTLYHLFDAERWWVGNWTTGPHPFPQTDDGTSISSLGEQWKDVAKKRNEVIAKIDETEAQRIVEILAGGPPTKFRVGESVIHLAVHGSHHRAQLINMLRHVNTPLKNIDLLYAIDELGPSPAA
jgi:uncharacterized damage-inducible protein DinB